MPTGEEQNVFMAILNADGQYTKIDRISNLPEISEDESIETSELSDIHREWSIEFFLKPPQNYRELRSFIEAVHPSLNYVIWWENTYGCNNWRKMHGLPMLRKVNR